MSPSQQTGAHPNRASRLSGLSVLGFLTVEIACIGTVAFMTSRGHGAEQAGGAADPPHAALIVVFDSAVTATARRIDMIRSDAARAARRIAAAVVRRVEGAGDDLPANPGAPAACPVVAACDRPSRKKNTGRKDVVQIFPPPREGRVAGAHFERDGKGAGAGMEHRAGPADTGAGAEPEKPKSTDPETRGAPDDDPDADHVGDDPAEHGPADEVDTDGIDSSGGTEDASGQGQSTGGLEAPPFTG